jgi:hypothetical protein
MTDWDRSASPELPPPASVYLQLGAGIVLTFALHLLALAGLTAAAWAALALGAEGPAEALAVAGGVLALGIGLAQVVYVLPAVAVTWVVRRPLALGILVGAGLTFVLNSACYGLLGVGAFSAG